MSKSQKELEIKVENQQKQLIRYETRLKGIHEIQFKSSETEI